MSKKRNSVSAVDFVKVFAPLAKEGKTALEIGQVLGLQGDADKIAAYVNLKSYSLRKRLKQMAEDKGLSVEDTNELVNRIPKLKGTKSVGRQASVMEDVLAALNSL